MDLPLPQYPDDMDERYSDFDRAFIRWYGLDRKDIRDPIHLLAMRRGFAALAHYVDDKVGELVAVLEEQGLSDNTVIIFTSDHGEMLGGKDLIQKRSLYEWSSRIPLIIDYPGQAHRRVQTPVSLIDLPATLLDIVGQKSVRPLAGRPLLAAVQGEELELVPVISEYHGEGIMRPSFMVRIGPWKYIYCHRSEGQLFNIDEDPNGWNNCAGMAEYAQIEEQLLDVITGGQFDLDLIEADIWARLAQKQVVKTVMQANGTAWDYKPEVDASVQYVRK